MQKPPLYFKVWLWLLLNAQHKDYGTLKRGQLFTSIPQIQDAMTYKVGNRIERPSKKQIWGILEWLRKPTDNKFRNPAEGNPTVTPTEPMIVTTKVTHGMIVTICKYDYFQSPENYEGNAESDAEGTPKERRRERQGNNKNNNDIRNNNDNNDTRRGYSVPAAQNDAQEIVTMVTENINPILNPIEIQLIQEWINEHPKDLIIEAIKETALNKATSIKYTDTILRSWQSKNIRTLQDLEHQKSKRVSNRKRGSHVSEPEWLENHEQYRKSSQEEEIEVDVNQVKSLLESFQ